MRHRHEARPRPRPLDSARASLSGAPFAYFDGRLATGLREVSHDPAALDRPGWWAVVGTFEGRWTCARFEELRPAPAPKGTWRGPRPAAWSTSLDRAQYEAGVTDIRERIARGDVYQANLCRVLSAKVDAYDEPAGLAARLAQGNPAPYAGIVDLPDHGVRVVSASPEQYLSRQYLFRHGDTVTSSPIKGTGRTEAELKPKDAAENVMIVDLVRNDLSRVAIPGTVTVPELCVVEKHPGLVHLVSTVRARLRPGVGWPELLAASFPPGSVTGAPKHSALSIIGGLEPTARGPYCGAIGWVDATRGTASLAVGIRSFWFERGTLRFGTGAGITWGSDPADEWDETRLKAARLIALASDHGSSDSDGIGPNAPMPPYDAAHHGLNSLSPMTTTATATPTPTPTPLELEDGAT